MQPGQTAAVTPHVVDKHQLQALGDRFMRNADAGKGRKRSSLDSELAWLDCRMTEFWRVIMAPLTVHLSARWRSAAAYSLGGPPALVGGAA